MFALSKIHLRNSMQYRVIYQNVFRTTKTTNGLRSSVRIR